MRAWLVCLGCIVACKSSGGGGGGGGGEYKHENPSFKLPVPSGLAAAKEQTDGEATNLSIRNERGDREIFLVWAPTGSGLDPVASFGRYGNEPDHTKTIEEGTIAGGGKFIENARGPRTFIHAVTTSGNSGILCMASYPTDKPDAELKNACKALTPL